MKVGNVKMSDNRIVIKGEPASLMNKLLLGLLFISSLLVFIALSVSLLYGNQSFSFQAILFLLITFGVGYLSLRFLIWHSFGKEVLILHPDRIEYYADYKYFITGKKSLKVERIEDTYGVRVNVLDCSVDNTQTDDDLNKVDSLEVTVLDEKDATFSEDNKVIETVITISTQEMKKIQDKLWEVYNENFEII